MADQTLSYPGWTTVAASVAIIVVVVAVLATTATAFSYGGGMMPLGQAQSLDTGPAPEIVVVGVAAGVLVQLVYILYW